MEAALFEPVLANRDLALQNSSTSTRDSQLQSTIPLDLFAPPVCGKQAMSDSEETESDDEGADLTLHQINKSVFVALEDQTQYACCLVLEEKEYNEEFIKAIRQKVELTSAEREELRMKKLE